MTTQSSNNHTIKLSHYDYDLKETVSDGEVSVYAIAKAITNEQIAYLLDNWVNNFSATYRNGIEIGHILRSTHRTLQRSIIVVLVGIIAGLSEQDHTDPRNEYAIHLAKQIKALYEEIGAGAFI